MCIVFWEYIVSSHFHWGDASRAVLNLWCLLVLVNFHSGGHRHLWAPLSSGQCALKRNRWTFDQFWACWVLGNTSETEKCVIYFYVSNRFWQSSWKNSHRLKLLKRVKKGSWLWSRSKSQVEKGEVCSNWRQIKCMGSSLDWINSISDLIWGNVLFTQLI